MVLVLSQSNIFMEDELWKKACANLWVQNVPFKNHMSYLHMFIALRNISWTKNYLNLTYRFVNLFNHHLVVAEGGSASIVKKWHDLQRC